MILNLDRKRGGRITPRSLELPFFDAVQENMTKLGYEGGWDLHWAGATGATANFRKALRSARDVEREWRALSRLRFGSR